MAKFNNGFRSGVFIAPYHGLDEDPTLTLRRDLDLIDHCDRLGYEEAWIGEHHSGGYELITSPELIIAAAAERTKRIMLGTGVVSLPYHNPLNVADRIVQLDHMSMGRVMFGIGPGLLPSDALMRGVDPRKQRERMYEAIDVILRLFKGERVTQTGEWFSLQDASLHLLPFTKPYPEICVASTFTPSGGKLAGKYGFGMLCLAATQSDGFGALSTNWAIANESAAEHGMQLDTDSIRLAGVMHIATTREQARKDIQFGLSKWLSYIEKTNPDRLKPLQGDGDVVDKIIANGIAVIGTAEDALAQLAKLKSKQGQFGCFLKQVYNWADWNETKLSFELYARYVVPAMRNANAARAGSLDWIGGNASRFNSLKQVAVKETIDKYQDEKKARVAAGLAR